MTEVSFPSRDAIVALLGSSPRPLHGRELAAKMRVSREEYDDFVNLLETMVDDRELRSLPGGKFGISQRTRRDAPLRSQPEREGVVTVHPRGFGFVASPGHSDDLYISDEGLSGAMHGDLVLARVTGRSQRGSEGQVVRVLRRAAVRVSGVLRRRGSSAWLDPDDSRVRGPILLRGEVTGDDGVAAVAKITRYPELLREMPEGEIVAVLGRPGDPLVEVQKILAREQIEENHPPSVVEQAEAYGSEVAAAALESREDLTHLPLPTIDPEDARDHDDAVWVERTNDGHYKAWIAIADVSHYVRPDTELDAVSCARGCSIYLPDRAIPMLPRALSGNLCSLLPGVIRLCLCVEVFLDATGEVQSYRIVRGFMRSAAKLTYGGVARTLGFTTLPPVQEAAELLVDGLKVLEDLATVLRSQRLRRGALDFDLPEAKIVLDPKSGAPLGVEKRSEDPGVKKAYRLIEEMMLLANELVARFLTERGVPAIYRVHGKPDETKLDRFAKMCNVLGVPFELEDAQDPKRLSALLKKLSQHPKRDIFNMLLLRAMKQATYDIGNIGHFGLASEAYLHFTSPIRRYPDLVVHRTVTQLLTGRAVDKSDAAIEQMRASALVASTRERKAMDIEREVVDLYRALYMQQHIGDSYVGKVTALVGSGVFVQIDSPFVDILVRFESLGSDLYQLDDDGLRVTGTRSGDVIALGDEMMVVVEDAALLRRTIYGRRVAGIAARPVDSSGPRTSSIRELAPPPRGESRAPSRPSSRAERAQPRAERAQPRAKPAAGGPQARKAERGSGRIKLSRNHALSAQSKPASRTSSSEGGRAGGERAAVDTKRGGSKATVRKPTPAASTTWGSEGEARTQSRRTVRADEAATPSPTKKKRTKKTVSAKSKKSKKKR